MSEIQEPVELIDLKVQLPEHVSGKVVSIPSTLSATLDELRQSLSIIHVSRNFTTFDIYYGDVNLSRKYDSLTTFSDILNDLQVDLTSKEINLIAKQKPYTTSSVFQHLEKFRESIGLHFLDKSAFADGLLRGGSKFDQLQLGEIKINVENEKADEKADGETNGKTDETNKTDKSSEPKLVLTTEEQEQLESLASSLLEPSTLVDSSNFATAANNLKAPIKSLSISSWSPVPADRKAKGDLLYIVIQTLEGETVQITCHVSGFFVNKCSTATFNPSIKISEGGKFHKHAILFDLVSELSPLFIKTIDANEQKLAEFSSLPEAYLLPTNGFVSAAWILNTKNIVTHPDVSRSQLPLLNNGVDGASNCKDWNEDIQSIKELPKSSIDERLLRDQLLSKSSFEFTQTASKTAVEILSGNVPAINPQDPPESRVYLRNGIFYFMNVNDSGAFDNSGDNEAARYTSSKDLAATRILNKVDAPGIANLVSCIVDYQGQRVICQAPIPGIFQEDQNKVVYGASVARDTIGEDKEFRDVLKPIAEALHLKPHSVTLDNGVKSEGELVLSKDTKGIRGTDGRKYVIDLYRSTPLDIEFIENHWDESENSYPHRETVLRHEAVEEWWKRKASVLFKTETERLEKEGKLKEGEEKPQIVLPTDQIVVNPDAFTGVSESSGDQDDVRELSKFIKEHLISEFLTEITTQIAPFDGAHLSKSLHNVGINLRYLGYIAEEALKRSKDEDKKLEETVKVNLIEAEKIAEEEKAKAEAKAKEAAENKDAKEENNEKEDQENENENDEEQKQTDSSAKFELASANLKTLHKIAIQEMIARASKHVLRKLSKTVPQFFLADFVAHFHNCLLGSEITETPEVVLNEELVSLVEESDLQFTKLTSKEVQELVKREVFLRFRYSLEDSWINEVSKASLLREIALKYGIQWKAQNYVFTKESFENCKHQFGVMETQTMEKKRSKKKKQSSAVMNTTSTERNTLFIGDDILGFVPIIKDSTHKSSLIDELYEVARVHLYKGESETGLSLLGELLGFCEQVYGRIHPETSRFYAAVAQIYSEVGMKAEACTFARRACVLAERISGFDSYETILAYINAAFYEGQNSDLINSVKLYKKVLDDWKLVYGGDHPSSINTLANLADSLTEYGIYGAAKEVYKKVSEISTNLNGANSAVTGMIHYRCARSLFAASDVKGALEEFKVAKDIFTGALGVKDILTKDTAELIPKFDAHIKYTAYMEAEAKRQKNAQAVTQKQDSSKKKKNGKKQGPPQSDPEIAQKSVDEILQFIEGKKSKKSKKSKK